MVLYHGFPPIGFEIVFQFDTIGSVIVYTAEAVIDFAGLEDETIFFAMGENIFKWICGHDVFALRGAKVRRYGENARGKGQGAGGKEHPPSPRLRRSRRERSRDL
jgi:hypothetical protein